MHPGIVGMSQPPDRTSLAIISVPKFVALIVGAGILGSREYQQVHRGFSSSTTYVKKRSHPVNLHSRAKRSVVQVLTNYNLLLLDTAGTSRSS